MRDITMRVMMLTLLSCLVIGCANTQPFTSQANRSHPNLSNVDPNCQRHVPPAPRTSQGMPNFNSPEHQEREFNRFHCR